MDFPSSAPMLLAFVYAMLVVYVANQAEAIGRNGFMLRVLLLGIVGFEILLGITALQTQFLTGETIDAADTPGVFVAAALLLSSASLSTLLILGLPSAGAVVRWASGAQGRFNPASSVHNAAAVLMLALVSITVGFFVLSGGLGGMAESLEISGVSPVESALVAALQSAVAFLGVGIAIRRTLAESLERLGLRRPTAKDVAWGIATAIALFVIWLVFVSIWQMVASSDQLRQQNRASDAMVRSFDTLPLAFIASASAAIGEEIFVRGALQPVFGLITTSAFFALLHTQYLITPGLLLIFVIALGLGWLRQRQSTTAAIIAHFVYNFGQLLLLVLGSF